MWKHIEDEKWDSKRGCESCHELDCTNKKILCEMLKTLRDIEECTCEDIEKLLKMILCKIDDLEPDKEFCRIIARLLNAIVEGVEEISDDTGNIDENVASLLECCNEIISRLDTLISEVGDTECCDNIIERLDTIIEELGGGGIDCCPELIARLDTIIAELEDTSCCEEINQNLITILAELATIIAELQDDTCCTEINDNLTSIIEQLTVIIAELQDTTCCQEILGLLATIITQLETCCSETNSNLTAILNQLISCCSELLARLDIIIGELGGGTSGICNSDNDFINELIEESGTLLIGEGEARRITAITAAFDSSLATMQNANSMTLQIGTINGTFTPVYSQCIPGTFANRQVGILNIAFTHPILVEGPVEVRFTLACGDGTPGNAFVSINVASCPVLLV